MSKGEVRYEKSNCAGSDGLPAGRGDGKQKKRADAQKHARRQQQCCRCFEAHAPGKTTCFNCISGVYNANEGAITLDGQDIKGKQPYQIHNLGLSRTYQIINLFADMTVIENVIVAMHADLKANFFDSMFHTKKHRGETPELIRDHGAKVVGLFEVPDYTREAHIPDGDRYFLMRLAFPWDNFGPDFAQMLSAIPGIRPLRLPSSSAFWSVLNRPSQAPNWMRFPTRGWRRISAITASMPVSSLNIRCALSTPGKRRGRLLP